jgi:hypothetical protein
MDQEETKMNQNTATKSTISQSGMTTKKQNDNNANDNSNSAVTIGSYSTANFRSELENLHHLKWRRAITQRLP